MNASEQARADAMADAEALRLALDGHFHLFGSEWLDGRIRWARRMAYPEVMPGATARVMACDARNAARAAFRAVPGLRWEDK